MEIILLKVRCIDTLELSGKIVEKDIGEFKSIRYNEFPLHVINITSPQCICIKLEILAELNND